MTNVSRTGGALVSVASAGSNSEREKESDNMCVCKRKRWVCRGDTLLSLSDRRLAVLTAAAMLLHACHSSS